jgi:protein phosphatase PTC1
VRFRPAANCTVDKVIPNDPSSGLFAIFDGHGGRQVSDYCAERFPLEIKKELTKNPADLTQSLNDVFLKINNELRLLDSDGCGSTACVAIVRKEGANNILYLANVGDSRAVLSKSGTAERLSIDDKCDNA